MIKDMNPLIASILVFVIISTFAVVFFTLNAKRLKQYDQWYACMYNKWDETQCNKLVYGD
jgi:hypothetical protein